jgi:hypothetical protein
MSMNDMLKKLFARPTEPVLARRQSCGALGLLLFLSLIYSTKGLANNEQAIKDFGVSRSDPIDKGFLFYGGTYIDAPYVVERRGLEIYINDVLVQEGPAWPPYDYRVENDPGDPPPDSAPFGSAPPGQDWRDTYWARKWRYLCSHHDYETAKQKMFETYARSPKVAKVRWRDNNPDMVVLTTESGKEHFADFIVSPLYLSPPPTKEEMLARREKKRSFYENMLNGNIILFSVPPPEGGEGYVPLRFVPRTLDILVSNRTSEEKIKALEAISVLPENDPGTQRIVTQFQASEQLVVRLGQLKEQIRTKRLLAKEKHSIEHIENGQLDLLAREGVAPAAQPNEPPGSNTPGDEPLLKDAISDPNLMNPGDNHSDKGATWLYLAIAVMGCLGVFALIVRKRSMSPKSTAKR